MQPNLKDQNTNLDEELTPDYLLGLIFRNKKLISLVAFITLFFSLIYAIVKPKVWQGQFDIVLEKNNDDKSGPLSLDSLFSSLTGSSGTESKLETEVGILESPLVLMPTFKFVKSERGINTSSKELLFSSWMNDLETELVENTSILNIRYRDKNKKIIIPVLEKISKDYQKYSGEKKRREMQLSKSYLKGQLDLYKKISKESLIKLQKYSFDNDIVLDFPSRSIQAAQLQRAQQNANKQFANLSYFVETDSGLENTRVSAANKIKNIDIQLAKIYELDKEKLIPEYVISIMPSDYNPGLKKQLNQIETEIVIMKSKYTSKDPNVLRLEDSKSKMINLLKEKAIQFLKAEKISTQALMESVTRPKEVLIKYKELFRSAERDQMTLVQLENDLRVVNLQDARLEDPWKLITEPTLNKYPVGIAKRYILLIGIGLGIFFGIIIAYLKEKFSDIIFNKEELEILLGKKVFNLDLKNMNDDFILKKLLDDSKKQEISFLRIGNIDKEDYELFKDFIKTKFSSFLIDFRDEVKDIDLNRKNIIFCEIGQVRKKEIDKVKNYLDLFQLNLLGIFCFQKRY